MINVKEDQCIPEGLDVLYAALSRLPAEGRAAPFTRTMSVYRLTDHAPSFLLDALVGSAEDRPHREKDPEHFKKFLPAP